MLLIEETIDDVDFFAVKGLRGKFAMPRALIAFLRNARDNKVDEYIKEYIRRTDPMGEQDLDVNISKRQEVFDDAGVPRVLEIDIQDRGNITGGRIRIVATAKKSTHPSIDLSVESMTWLKQAAENWEGDDADDDDDDDDDDEDEGFENAIKARLPAGIFAKVSPQKVVLKTYKGRGYGKQSTINRAMFDDNADLKIAIDVAARGLLQMKRTAEDTPDVVRNAGEDVE